MTAKKHDATLFDYSENEAARRRDEVVRRMANTPPKPKVSPRQKRKMKAGEARVVCKGRDNREA